MEKRASMVSEEKLKTFSNTLNTMNGDFASFIALPGGELLCTSSLSVISFCDSKILITFV